MYSNLQIFKSSNLQIFKSLNLQIFKSSNLQIFKSSNLQIFKSSNLQIFKSSNLQIFKSSNLQIFKSSNLQIFKSSNLQIFKSSNLQIFKSSNLQIFKSSNLQSSNLQIFKSSNLQSSIFNLQSSIFNLQSSISIINLNLNFGCISRLAPRGGQGIGVTGQEANGPLGGSILFLRYSKYLWYAMSSRSPTNTRCTNPTINVKLAENNETKPNQKHQPLPPPIGNRVPSGNFNAPKHRTHINESVCTYQHRPAVKIATPAAAATVVSVSGPIKMRLKSARKSFRRHKHHPEFPQPSQPAVYRTSVKTHFLDPVRLMWERFEIE
ncbi:conserved hypothetical protein [Culex quinquefasciatus]|uniref:Uncharacterized protein n=1 Tax=Culex quinquefasciatus TaxID=7176 RepID=B0X2C6_CULQU|nr:conserved hypothetical protein [Culex quinquefasciatus]|eukprot:XP_001863798.1 conserved hypothetical protein [Culex quinquefasciatus]